MTTRIAYVCLAIPIALAAVGVAILAGIAFVSGWSEAAARFPLGALPSSLRTTRYLSVWLRRRTATVAWVVFGSDEAAIYRVPAWPVRVFFAPLRLPRADVDVERLDGWLRLTVRGLRLELHLPDRTEARNHWPRDAATE